jgi:hypothetical protein
MASNTKTRRGSGSSDITNDRDYFLWLIEQVHEDGHQRTGYWGLFQILHDTEFVWMVPNDDNRVEDARQLRVEFAGTHGKPSVSVLEVLVALSRRVAWVASGTPEGWAWKLLCNLGLNKFRDPISNRKVQKVNDILYAVIWRTYAPDGVGGFFPLSDPIRDQRQVEIWYQMHAYVRESHPY